MVKKRIKTGWWLAGLLWMLLAGTPAAAQLRRPPASATVAAPDDRSAIRVRYPAPDRLRALRDDRAYRYDRDTRPPDSPWANFWDWFWRQVEALLQSRAYQSVGQYVLLAAIAGLVVWLLIRANVLTYLFPGRSESLPLSYTTEGDDIHIIPFDTRIDEAVAARNYRLAVRLLYLQTLKRLTDAGRIHWQPDKTNQQYVRELRDTPLEPGFARLTQQFAFIWYGDRPVTDTQFAQLRAQFDTFHRNPTAP